MAVDRPKIVIVDDSESALMFLALLLERMGFDVVPASTGREALTLVRAVKPALVLMDVRMPDMDGIAALRALKTADDLSDTPVIMVTVDAAPETREMCYQIGCSDYLVKPLDLVTLHSTVQRHVKLPREQRRLQLRVPYRYKVRMNEADTQSESYAMTLSEGGIYIRREQPLPVGTKLKVEIPLGDGLSVEISGQVIYVRSIRHGTWSLPPGMAIRFDTPSDEAAAAIRHFIAKQLAGDLVDEQTEVIIKLPDSPDSAARA